MTDNPLGELSSDLATYCSFAERLADLARVETTSRFRNGVEPVNKAQGDYDPVTDADREAERVQRRAIESAYPDHGILGEEFGETGAGARHRWVLDPVDGTRAFVCGVATWTTLIALEQDGAPLISVIDQPYIDERFIGAPGQTVFKRGEALRQCRTSGVQEISQARISTTDPRSAAYFSEAEAAAFARVAEAAQLARFSLDAYAYALLALGEIDLVIEAGLHHHDYAALKPVVEGAGGVISNWRGDDFDQADGGRLIAAASPQLHAAALVALDI